MRFDPDPIYVVFVVLAIFLVALFYFRHKYVKAVGSPQFKSFQKSFLVVYFIMMTADWLQGPYIYRLYSLYGFTFAQIGQLFIAGFGASLVFGTIVGSTADKYGRRALCITFGVTSMLSCATMHFNNFSILIVGRVLGGIATSLLYTAFESWLVAEHHSNDFAGEWLTETFSLMAIGNGIIANAAGWVARTAVAHAGHPVASFDASLLFLLVGTTLIGFHWRENVGDARKSTSTALREAVHTIATTKTLLLLGTIQTLFEAALYAFIFMWAPAMDGGGRAVPHSVVFASLMVCCSIGGFLFDTLSKRMPVETLLRGVFLVAAVCMAVPVVTRNVYAMLLAFLVFETSVGLFWPGMSTLRSRHIPKDTRATVMSLFRVPLNAVICLTLLFVGTLTAVRVFAICSLCYLICGFLQHLLCKISSK